MFMTILLTIAGWLLEAGVLYSLYCIIRKRTPALLYSVLLTWVFFQVINTLAGLATWSFFQEEFSLPGFYLMLAVIAAPFGVWAFLDRQKQPVPAEKQPLVGGEKAFLISSGVLFVILLASTLRYEFLPRWGNVDMANQYNAINALHAKIMPGWDRSVPYVVQASAALRDVVTMWGYIFGLNFHIALISRLTFIETIYVLNIATCLNLALWLSAPLILVDWKKARVWSVLYWIWIVFSVSSGWYSAVERGWLSSIYSLGQCVLILACIFYMSKQENGDKALRHVTIGIGSFLVANAHPYNYPIYLLSVVLMALFSGEQRVGKRLSRAFRYGVIGLLSLLPLLLISGFKNVVHQIVDAFKIGDLSLILDIRDFEMLTNADAPMWLGIGGMAVGMAVIIIVVRTIKKSYIVGVSAVATVVALYAVYGSNGYLYQKEAFMTPPLFFMLALQIIHDLWQVVYRRWIAPKTRYSTEKWQTYVVVPVLLAALLVSGQIGLGKGLGHIWDRFVDVPPMIEPDYYRVAKAMTPMETERSGRGPVSFRALDGARKMFLSRIVREDDLAQTIPGLPYYAVEPTSFYELIECIDITPVKEKGMWEDGWYLVHDKQERTWPQFQTLSLLMTDIEEVYSSGDIAITRMTLRPGIKSVYIPFASGYRPVHIERPGTRIIDDEDMGWMLTPAAAEPTALHMENPLAGARGDLMFLFRGRVSDQGRVTLRLTDANGGEIVHTILPSFDEMTAVVVPEESLGQGAHGIEIMMEPGSVPDSAALQWMRIYALPSAD